ncbi:MAG: NAD(P)H-binding protein, partial [Candidatus Eisenbacteria bacterium]|nr:NAD(P)H-binding protein [Candidatus Latescibacterota bacterium]MBD3302090.1 NAD(P)H-binding protein [Candidatus Eisenbacteria bacterium]
MRFDDANGRADAGSLAGLRALVLGGTGLIGSHVVASLLRRGAAVRVMSRSAGDAPALRGLSVEIVTGRIEEIDSVRRALDGMDLLFHCAAPYP